MRSSCFDWMKCDVNTVGMTTGDKRNVDDLSCFFKIFTNALPPCTIHTIHDTSKCVCVCVCECCVGGESECRYQCNLKFYNFFSSIKPRYISRRAIFRSRLAVADVRTDDADDDDDDDACVFVDSSSFVLLLSLLASVAAC